MATAPLVSRPLCCWPCRGAAVGAGRGCSEVETALAAAGAERAVKCTPWSQATAPLFESARLVDGIDSHHAHARARHDLLHARALDHEHHVAGHLTCAAAGARR